MRIKDKKAIERYKKKLDLARSRGVRNSFETKEETRAAIERAKIDIEYCVERYFPEFAFAKCADFQIEWANIIKKDHNFIGFCKWGRGLAKSVWNNVIIPFWLWLRGEPVYMVVIGVNQKKACQLLEDLRSEFEGNAQIIHDFGIQHNPGSWDEELWVTKGGFIAQALGFGQSCRGLRVGAKRPSYYNLDDLETKRTIKKETNQEEMVTWVEEELLPSMDGTYERLIFSNNWFAPVMFLKKLAEKHPDWKVHEVKAYNAVTYEPRWKSKYTPDYYKKKAERMGLTAADAEYNHNPVIKGGKIFKAKYINWTKLPRIDHFKIITAHWDIAYAGTETSDFNAVRLWGLYNNEFYYIRSFVKQTKMNAAVKYMIDIDKSLPPGVQIFWRAESQFWNDEVKRVIKEEETAAKHTLNITLQTNKRNKFTKIVTILEAKYQNGRIHHNEKMKSDPDSQIGLNQLYGIGPGYSTKDDAPDADAEAVEFLEQYLDYGGNNGEILQGRMEPNHERI